MMSAGKFIENRVQRALDTWLQHGKWKVEVFAAGDLSQVLVPQGLDFNIVTLVTLHANCLQVYKDRDIFMFHNMKL